MRCNQKTPASRRGVAAEVLEYGPGLSLKSMGFGLGFSLGFALARIESAPFTDRRSTMAAKNGGRNGGTAQRPTFTDQEALLFHSQGRPGKLEIVATKPMATQRDLSLAYSPGVAVPVLAIADDESKAFDYTTKGNFVAVITNGTAILGLGNRGALAAKPVMEGKAVLFKRFADIDSID